MTRPYAGSGGEPKEPATTELADYLAWARVERGLSPGTVRAYERELRALGGDRGAITALTSEALRSVLHARGGAHATVARRLAAWSSFYGWLVRTGQRSDDPTARLDRPRVHRGLPRPVGDLSRRLAMLDPEARAIAVLLSETGLRISEACAINIGLPVPHELIVLGKGGRERVVPLTEDAREALSLLEGHVHLSPRTIQRRFRDVGFTPHRLRHTAATELIESGADIVDVQKILGHTSPATTTIYAAYSTGRLRDALERRRRK